MADRIRRGNIRDIGRSNSKGRGIFRKLSIFGRTPLTKRLMNMNGRIFAADLQYKRLPGAKSRLIDGIRRDAPGRRFFGGFERRIKFQKCGTLTGRAVFRRRAKIAPGTH